MLMHTFAFTAFTLACLFFSPSDGTAARGYQGCALAGTKIYCYGGYTGYMTGFVYTPAVADFLSLDLATFDFTNVSSTADYWTLVPPPSNFVLEPNAGLTMISISNKSKLFLYGGFGQSNTVLINSTTVYDPQSNSWSSIPNTLPYYASSGACVDVGDSKLYAWGGVVNNTAVIAPNQVKFLDYSTNQWTVTPVSGNAPFDYTLTLAGNGYIYLIGGVQGLASNNTGYYTSMNVINWYNTVGASWGYDNATGQNIQPRKYHTADYIPGTTKILIYGGVQNSATSVMPVSDFCYLYDYQQKLYTPISFESGGAGPRAGHSTVLYQTPSKNATYLFLLFGYDNNIKFKNDNNVMNLTDLNKLTWLTPNNNANSPPTSENPDHGGLSTGAIVGISIGCVIVGIGLATFAVIWFFRKRRQRQEFSIEQSDPRHHSMDASRIGGGGFAGLDYATEVSSSQPMTSLASDDGTRVSETNQGPNKFEIVSKDEMNDIRASAVLTTTTLPQPPPSGGFNKPTPPTPSTNLNKPFGAS